MQRGAFPYQLPIKGPQMSRRQSTVLAFALAGALSLTVVSVSAAFAADAGAAGRVNAAAPLQADAGGFVINADGVLVGYTGGVTEVRITEGVTKIGTSAFTGAHLTKAWVPASVREIDDLAFAHRPLEEITFQDDDHPSQLTIIGERVFLYTPLEHITLPRSVEMVGPETFGEMKKLRSVHVGPSMQAGGLLYAFTGNPLLERIDVD